MLLGSKNIEEMVAARFAKLDVIRHVARYFGLFLLALGLVWWRNTDATVADLVGSRLWAALDVTYRVKGDPAKEDFLVPCICVFTLVTEGAETGKIADLEIYMDQTAVAERMESVAFYTLTSSNGRA